MISHKTISLLALAALTLAACEKRNDGSYTVNTDESKKVDLPKAEPKPADEKPLGDKASDILKKADNDQVPAAKGGGQPAEGSREWARDKMARVRCDHYQSCGDIAKDKKYETFDSCVVRERASLDKDWKLDDCKTIDTPRLDACIKAVNAKKCDVLFTSFPGECASSKVCIEK